MHVRIQDGRADDLIVLAEDWKQTRKLDSLLLLLPSTSKLYSPPTVLEVELVELHSGYQIAERVWFKGGHVRVTQFPAKQRMGRG